jgi:hypothetical protein
MFVIQQDFDFARQSNQASSGGGTTGSSEAAPLGQFGCLPDKERKKKTKARCEGIGFSHVTATCLPPPRWLGGRSYLWMGVDNHRDSAKPKYFLVTTSL